MSGRRPSNCERCGGVVRVKDETWWCWACDRACEPIRPHLGIRSRGPDERRARVKMRAYGSDERLAWIHSLTCVVGWKRGHQCFGWDTDIGRYRIQAVHVRARGMGAAKGGADDIVPGCARMHAEAGEYGTSQRAAFERRFSIDLVKRAREIAEDWNALGMTGDGTATVSPILGLEPAGR